MSSRFLDYEVTLLLAKYGKNAVLAAMAEKLHLTPEELEALLRKPPRAEPALRPRKATPIADPLSQVVQEHPAKAQLLRSLHGRFENRTFLPEFRDVRRFFERHARSLGSVKSRSESLPRLLQLLAALDIEELDALCQDQPRDAYSSLGLISDEILRKQQ